jgi:hypothetical protein
MHITIHLFLPFSFSFVLHVSIYICICIYISAGRWIFGIAETGHGEMGLKVGH